MKSERKTISAKRAARAADGAATELLRPCLLMALVALCVARPLLPSEGVSWLGDGQPFNMLALVLTVAYLVSAVFSGGLAHRMTLVDWSVAALVLICGASALVSITPQYFRQATGSPRLAINMQWEWVGMGLIFFLTRQLVRTPRETRALVAVMVALAVVLGGFGFYQVLIGLPADRAAYAENPDELLRSLGQWFPPDSPERARFEDRLESTEPLATFALTNSLAGFLAPWLVIALGIAVSLWTRRPKGRNRRGCA